MKCFNFFPNFWSSKPWIRIRIGTYSAFNAGSGYGISESGSETLFPMQRAVELEKKDVGGKSDPYCLIQYSDQKYQTKVNYWLNMELGLQSSFGLLCTAVLIG